MQQQGYQSRTSAWKGLPKEMAAEAVLDHQAEIDLLDDHSKTVVANLLEHICAKFEESIAALCTQIDDQAQQKIILTQRIESHLADLETMEQQNETLRIDLQTAIFRHYEYAEELDLSKSELHHEKRIAIQQGYYHQSLEQTISECQRQIEQLEEQSQALKEQYLKEKERNQLLEQQNHLIKVKYTELEQQFQISVSQKQQLSSNFSQHDEELRQLRKIIEEQDFVCNASPAPPSSHLNISLQHKKTLQQEEPDTLRLSQTQDPLSIPPLPLKSLKKTSECRTKRDASRPNTKPNTTSEKKIVASNPPKMVRIKHEKKVSSLESKQEESLTKRSNKQKSQRMGMGMKERLNEIFKDRVKFKIESDLRHHREVTALRCRLRAKENQNVKLEKELKDFKKSSIRLGSSAALSSKSQRGRSRKSSRYQPSERWLESELQESQKNQNPALNNSCEELAEEKQELECSPKGKENSLYRKQSSDNELELRRLDQFQEFNLNEHQMGHHFLHSELDIHEDISFKNESSRPNERQSLSGSVEKRKRCLSIYSQPGSQILLSKDRSLQEGTTQNHQPGAPQENSPALLRVPVQGQMTPYSSSLQEVQNLTIQQYPLDKSQQRVLFTSYLNTERHSNSVSQFQLYYHQPHRDRRQHIRLGSLAEVRCCVKNLAISSGLIGHSFNPQVKEKQLVLAQEQNKFVYFPKTKIDQSAGTDTLVIVNKQANTQLEMQELYCISFIPPSPKMQNPNRKTSEKGCLTTGFAQQSQTLLATPPHKQAKLSIECTLELATNCKIDSPVSSQEAYTNTEVKTYADSSVEAADSQLRDLDNLGCDVQTTMMDYQEKLCLQLYKQAETNTQASTKDIYTSTDPTCLVDQFSNTPLKQLKGSQQVSLNISFLKPKRLQLTHTEPHNYTGQKMSSKFSLSKAFSDKIQSTVKRRLASSLQQTQCCILKIEPKLFNLQLDQKKRYQNKMTANFINLRIDPTKRCQLSIQRNLNFLIVKPYDEASAGGNDIASEYQSFDSQYTLPLQTSQQLNFPAVDGSPSQPGTVRGASPLPSPAESYDSMGEMIFRYKEGGASIKSWRQQLYEKQRSNNSSRVSDFKLITPSIGSKFNSPYLQKSILSEIDLEFSVKDEDLLKRYFTNLRSIKLKNTISHSTSSDSILDIEDLRYFYCEKDGEDYEMALFRGKLLMLRPEVHLMELPALKLSSIHARRGQLIMGNCEVLIAEDRLSINRSGKVKFFRGQMPEGDWRITHMKVYKVTSAH